MIKNINTITELLAHLALEHEQKHIHFHMFSFEEDFNKIPKSVSLNSNQYFELTLVKGGNTKVIIDEKETNSDKSHITLLSPGQSINIDSKSEPGVVQGYILFFTIDFFESIASIFNFINKYPTFKLHFTPVYFLTEKHSKLLFDLMKKMYDQFTDADTVNFEIVKLYLKIILEEINSLTTIDIQNFSSRAEEITYKFENLLRSHMQLSLVKEYASELYISSIYLSECIKKVTGKSAKSVIIDYKLMQAKSFLKNSEKTIDEISIELGFDDRSNFINFFKKYSRLPPRKYRIEYSSS